MRAPGYANIFDQRGDSYQRAMSEQPSARAAEFQTLIERAAIEPGMFVIDLPSGGAYLGRYLPDGVRCVHVETSRTFFDAARATGREVLFAERPARLTLADASVDRVLSLAGLHHEDDRLPIYREVRRVLRPGGRFVIGEVLEGSAVARFLDGFVDAHGSGHVGSYLAAREGELLREAGFEVDGFEVAPTPWRARTYAELARFVRDLFSVHRATEVQVQGALCDQIGLRESPLGVELAWELVFFSCRRVA